MKATAIGMVFWLVGIAILVITVLLSIAGAIIVIPLGIGTIVYIAIKYSQLEELE